MDCAKATSAVDRAICADKDLKAQDAALGRVYFATLRKLSGRRHDTLIDEQRIWLKSRSEECAAVADKLPACLGKKTAARITQISACFGGAAPDPSAGDVLCTVIAHAACPEWSVAASASVWRYPFLVAKVEQSTADSDSGNEDKCGAADKDHPGTPDQNTDNSQTTIEGAGKGWVAVRLNTDSMWRGAAHPMHEESVTTYDSATGREFPISQLMPILKVDPHASHTLWDAANEHLDVPCCGDGNDHPKFDDIIRSDRPDSPGRPLPDAWSIEPDGSLKVFYGYSALARAFVATSVLRPSTFIKWVDNKYLALFAAHR